MTFRVTPVLTTGYVAGDVVGTGNPYEIAGLPQPGGLTKVRLRKVSIRDSGSDGPALKLLLFRQSPAGATMTDSGAFAYGSSAFTDEAHKILVASANYDTTNAKKSQHIALDDMIEGAGNSLFLVIIANSAWNPLGASNLSIEFNFEAAF